MDELRAVLQRLLEHPLGSVWTAQGLGMLRTTLADSMRLQIYDPALRVPGVTDRHTHPWGFESLIIAGSLVNQRYTKCNVDGAAYSVQTIRCGPGAELLGEPIDCRLRFDGETRFKSGDRYSMTPRDIHTVLTDPGTITIINRDGNDTERADVFIPRGEQWVSAEPYTPLGDEIARACNLGLARLREVAFNG